MDAEFDALLGDLTSNGELVTGEASCQWAAFADIDQRSIWSVPLDEAIVYDSHEFTPGGVDEYRCGPPEDLANQVTMRYVTIDAPRSFIATASVRHHGTPIAADISEWTLEAAGDHTQLRVTIQLTSLVGPAMVDGYRNGNERTLDHLEHYLASQGG